MKNIPYKLHIIAAALVLLFSACSKQLNVYPTTSEVDGNVIKDLQSAKTTLNGVYYQFANAGFDNNQNPSIVWSAIHEVIGSELSGMFTYPYGGSDITEHLYQSSSSSISGIWSYGMGIVNAANGFLKNLDPVTTIGAADKIALQAEAKFLRAFANATLLFYYGQYGDPSSAYGIVLRKEFITTKNINHARSTVKETYDFILADLDDAIQSLPDQNSANIYANVWAAKLLKARVLMVRNQAADRTAVIELCQDIIQNSPYQLAASYKDLFWNKGLQSTEVILGVQPYDQDIYKYSLYMDYNSVVGTDLMIDLFKNDPRGYWIMQAVDNTSMGGQMQVITKYYDGNPEHPTPTANSSVSYAFRLTEAYLLEAEAITQSGGDLSEAKALLTSVLAKAGVTDFSEVNSTSSAAALQLLIIKEEMKNFVGESGQDWLAVRRLPFATLQKLLPSIGTKDLLVLPIPQEEMKRNSGLKGMQNPGYGQL